MYYLVGHSVRGLNPDLGVPLARWQHCHLLQELVNGRHNLVTIVRLERHFPEHLEYQSFISL